MGPASPSPDIGTAFSSHRSRHGGFLRQAKETTMTFFRSKSIGEELLGRAQRIAGAATDRHPREALGAARDYAGQPGGWASEVSGGASREVRRHPRMGIALGASLGLG